MPQQITCVYDLCPHVTQKALHRLQLCSDQLTLMFKCRPHGTHWIGPSCSLSVKGKISDRMWVSFDKIHASMSQIKLLQGTVQVAATKIILVTVHCTKPLMSYLQYAAVYILDQCGLCQ